MTKDNVVKGAAFVASVGILVFLLVQAIGYGVMKEGQRECIRLQEYSSLYAPEFYATPEQAERCAETYGVILSPVRVMFEDRSVLYFNDWGAVNEYFTSEHYEAR